MISENMGGEKIMDSGKWSKKAAVANAGGAVLTPLCCYFECTPSSKSLFYYHK